MEYELNFEHKKSKPEVKATSKEYFLSQGFKLESEADNYMIIKRGSLLKNLITMDALRWKSLITIDITDTNLKAVFNINTTSQLATKEEEQLWEKFILNYERAIADNFDYQQENTQLASTTKSTTKKYAVALVLSTLCSVAPLIIISEYTGVKSISTYGAPVALTTFATYYINKAKKGKEGK